MSESNTPAESDVSPLSRIHLLSGVGVREIRRAGHRQSAGNKGLRSSFFVLQCCGRRRKHSRNARRNSDCRTRNTGTWSGARRAEKEEDRIVHGSRSSKHLSWSTPEKRTPRPHLQGHQLRERVKDSRRESLETVLEKKQKVELRKLIKHPRRQRRQSIVVNLAVRRRRRSENEKGGTLFHVASVTAELTPWPPNA